MRNYVIRSLLSGIILLFFMSVVIFVLVRIVPGDPALGILAAKASAERGIDPVRHAELREKMGLNEPMVKQYGLWIADTVTGDLGNSVAFRNKPVLEVVKNKFAVTLQITVMGLALILVIGLIFGTVAAINQGSMLDSIIRLIAVSGMAVPNFLAGTLLVYFLVKYFNWFPPAGNFSLWEDPWPAFQQTVWPALALGFYFSALLTRMVRNTMLEVLREDFIRTARAKGLPSRLVTFRHALRNTMAPNLTMYSLLALNLLGGSVIVENIFNVRGMGQAFVSALNFRDYEYIQATLLIVGALVVLVNLATDLAYGFFDPRIRRE